MWFITRLFLLCVNLLDITYKSWGGPSPNGLKFQQPIYNLFLQLRPHAHNVSCSLAEENDLTMLVMLLTDKRWLIALYASRECTEFMFHSFDMQLLFQFNHTALGLHSSYFKIHTHEPRHEKFCLRESPTRQDTNWPAQLQGPARILKFRIYKLEVSFCLGSKQQRRWSDCTDAQADLHLCCLHMA